MIRKRFRNMLFAGQKVLITLGGMEWAQFYVKFAEEQSSNLKMTR